MLKGKRKFGLIAVVLVIVLFEGYSMATKPPPPKMKIKGTVYELPQSFLLNLNGGQYAKLDVALLLAPSQSSKGAGAASSGGGGGGEGEHGTLPEEAVIRAIITNAITDQSSQAVIDERGRVGIEHRILNAIDTQTDVKVQAVLFPDLTVQ